ncbi:hypothetical protein V2I01_10905 [Micromonospora sp. BRA006-A]|nr:hypothetical protein [Micromonospora sp. BRA006-A]
MACGTPDHQAPGTHRRHQAAQGDVPVRRVRDGGLGRGPGGLRGEGALARLGRPDAAALLTRRTDDAATRAAEKELEELKGQLDEWKAQPRPEGLPGVVRGVRGGPTPRSSGPRRSYGG